MSLIISGVIDGPLSGGTPKAIELFVTEDVADLSVFAVGSANNGGGSDGEELTLSGSASAGDYIYVASDQSQFNAFFGFDPNFVSSAASINGDDAIELFQNGAVIDVFGEIDTDGTGEPWEYLDGWAYRDTGTGPDGATFVLDNWSFSGPNALDGESANDTAATPFPVQSFSSSSAAGIEALVFNEVLADPNSATNNFDTDGDGTAETSDEFVEVFNTSGGAIDISGFEFWDSGSDNYFTVPADTILAAGGYIVVVANVADGALPIVEEGSHAFSASGGLSLSNGGDNLVLYDPNTDSFIQAIYNGDSIDDPTDSTSSDYEGFSTTATRVGDVQDFGNDTDGVSLALSPDGDTTNPVAHNTIGDGVVLASPGASNDGVADEEEEEEPALPVQLQDEVLAQVDLDGAEIVKTRPDLGLAFVTAGSGFQIVDFNDFGAITSVLIDPLPNSNIEGANDSGVTSIDVNGDGIVAVGFPGIDSEPQATNNGEVHLYETDGTFIVAIEVGPLPDMVTFDETGQFILVANEGESADATENSSLGDPNPEGSVSIITVDGSTPANSTVVTIPFDPSITFEQLLDKGVRVDPRAESPAADLEPEFISIVGTTAFIALQENNAVAVIEDITNPPANITLENILPLGTQDFSTVLFDPSNEDGPNGDGAINLTNYEVQGFRMPDAIAAFEVDGVKYFATANEGDGRGDFDEDLSGDEARGDDLLENFIDTDEVSQEIQDQLADDAQLGRLKFSTIDGDIDGDGKIEELFSFGARSFSIFDENGNLIFDSGDEFERFISTNLPELHNANDGVASEFDQRSDDKGVEPEAITIGQVGASNYAFIGLERVGGVMVYDITDLDNVEFDSYIRNDSDIAPEGLDFISAEDSPTGEALLVVASEDSNTLTFHELTDDFVAIHTIQGSTDFTNLEGAQVGVDDISPLAGEIVSVQAIVTAEFQDTLSGFFLQEEDRDADADASTSEGIFVFDDSLPVDVQVGDLVEVTGEVSEFFGQTQITASEINIVSSGNDLPTAEVIDFADLGAILDDDGAFVVDLESVEGMLVTIPEALTVTEMFNLDRFGEYRVSSEGRLVQFTQENAPDVDGFQQHLEDIASRSLVIDDGRSDQNPETLTIVDGNDGVLTADDSFRMGDELTNLTGVINYSFDEFRLQDPTGDYTEVNPRPEAPINTGGFKIASLNVLNYFTTIDDGSAQTDTGAEPRGADDLTRFSPDNSDLANNDPNAEFNRQEQKIVNAILAIDADVLGLVELENSATDDAISTLVDAVNDALGENIYDFIPTGVTGDDAITNGFIYKTTTVNPIGDVIVLEEFDGVSFLDPLDAGRSLNRPAVIQNFEEIESGATFTAAVNHFKSKGSLSGLPEDEDQGDGAGNNNATREAASRLLADFLDADESVQDNVIILGDLNAYAEETPVTVLEDRGYTDIAQALIDDPRSFVFDGQVGTLDYALVNENMLDFLTGATEWHINADEADAIDYNLDFGRSSELFDGDSPARNSDHDPVIGGFDFDPEPYTLEILHIADQEASTPAIVDAPNLSAVLNALRDQDLGDDGIADNTLTLSSGDAFIPGVFFSASEAVFGVEGLADFQIQNELGIQAIALGNHEFDSGTGLLASLISGEFESDVIFDQDEFIGTDLEGVAYGGTDFPYLSANLDFSTDSNLAPLEIEGGQTPQGGVVTSSTVIEQPVPDLPDFPELIGIVGATTPTLNSISSPGDVGISPSPFDANPTDEQLDALAAEIQAEVDQLLADNPTMNKVILMAHMQQLSIEQELAERLTDVDVIIAGGSNTRLFDDNDRARDGDSDQGEYPIFVENAGGTTTAVVNTDGSYKYVGRLVIDFDAQGNIIPDSYDEDVSGAFATDEQGVIDLGAQGLIDPEIQAIADAIEAQIIAAESNVFGVSEVFLNGNRSGVADDPADTDGVRTQETNLGNLTADANLFVAQQADSSVLVSIKNGGGIRESIGEDVVPAGGTESVRTANAELVDGDGNVFKEEGGISQNDIQTVLAFNNDLVLLTLTHAELAVVLEHGVSALPDVSGRFPQVSGVKFSFDPDLPEGDRIVNAGVFDENDNLIAELIRDGEIVTPDAEIRIVTLGFLASPRFDDGGNFIGGGDGYPFPNTDDQDIAARVNPVELEQEGVQSGAAVFADDGTEQDALAEYLLAEFGTAEDAFDFADTGRDEDERIQNLNFREDDVLDDTPPPPPSDDDDQDDDDQGDDQDDGDQDDGDQGGDQPTGGGDVMTGDDGDNPIFGGAGGDVLDGGAGSDTVGGGRGSDTVSGGEGADLVRGGRGGDLVLGGEGDDTVSGGRGGDTVEGGTGDDTVLGGRGRDDLSGGADNDDLRGGLGSDTLAGDGGDDILRGGLGADELDGGAGNDTLNGGLGPDTLTGGAGEDVFQFFDRAGSDTITDFEDGVDQIEILGGAPNFDALSIVDVDGGAEIGLRGTKVLVEGVSAADLTEDDFIFS